MVTMNYCKTEGCQICGFMGRPFTPPRVEVAPTMPTASMKPPDDAIKKQPEIIKTSDYYEALRRKWGL